MGYPKAITRFWHPSLSKLTWYRTTGKLRRCFSALRSKRKLWLSILAVVLGVIWLGQTVLAILFREAADPAGLRTYLSVSMLLYSLFHCVKIGCRKPTEPFEWTESEKQWLIAGPVTRTQLVTYRLASYLAATAAKALCFAVVMLPDLHMIAAGYSGMFLGLTLVDLIRMLLEQVAWMAEKISKRCWLIVRSAMVLPVVGLLGFAVISMTWSPEFTVATESKNPIAIPKLLLGNVGELVTQPALGWLMLPWSIAADTILAETANANFFFRLGLLYVFVLSLSSLLYYVDRKSVQWRKQLELSAKRIADPKAQDKTKRAGRWSRFVPTGHGGAKAIIWHHVLGAIHHRSALIMSLLIPTILSCIPLMAGEQTTMTSLSVLGSVVFYSFLLLPPALMLDYRRDVNRLAMWKSSPVRPFTMTVGQLTVPVALMSLFQIGVVTITVFVFGHPWQMLLALPILMPLNVMILAIENAIFLAHPYRRNEEGFGVFLRTILTFTGKGVLFALGLLLVMLWAWSAILISKAIHCPDLFSTLFAAGMLSALSILAWLSIQTCSRLFERLDISYDLPAA